MRRSTKNALLIALFSQKPSKKDAPVFYISSLICVSLILIGSALESTFLFRTGLGLIFVVPMLLGPCRNFIANKGTSGQTIYTIHFAFGLTMGILFLLALSASLGGLLSFLTDVCAISVLEFMSIYLSAFLLTLISIDSYFN